MVKEKPTKKRRTPPTLEGLAEAIDNLSVQMMNGFSFFGERLGALEQKMDDKVEALEVKISGLEFGVAACNSKIEGVHRRIDDVVETRASRGELDSTNKRVGRIEAHLKLA